MMLTPFRSRRTIRSRAMEIFFSDLRVRKVRNRRRLGRVMAPIWSAPACVDSRWFPTVFLGLLFVLAFVQIHTHRTYCGALPDLSMWIIFCSFTIASGILFISEALFHISSPFLPEIGMFIRRVPKENRSRNCRCWIFGKICSKFWVDLSPGLDQKSVPTYLGDEFLSHTSEKSFNDAPPSKFCSSGCSVSFFSPQDDLKVVVHGLYLVWDDQSIESITRWTDHDLSDLSGTINRRSPLESVGSKTQNVEGSTSYTSTPHVSYIILCQAGTTLQYMGSPGLTSLFPPP